MSSGEADVRTLDAFTRCGVPGCDVMVMLGGTAARCWAHGGPDGIPEYLTDTDSGAFIHVRHMNLPPADCE